MKLRSSIGTACFLFLSAATFSQATDSSGNATVPPEIENPEIIGINKQPAHATLMPYANLKEALAGNRHASSFCNSLNGTWKFNWVNWPQKRPVDFYKTDYDVSGWKDIQVPSNWQIKGYGTPFYRNIGYTFQKDFPHVMSTPPKEYTAYHDRNPVGSYRRNFEVPANWAGSRIFITFDGVDAGFFLWVNGTKVGYSINSRNAAEFDITDYVNEGNNMVAVEVYQYTSGSYLEDQDMWRLSGIFRNVTLWQAPVQHIRDFYVKTNLDAQYQNATTAITTKIKNYGSSPTKAQEIVTTLYDDAKQIITTTTGAVKALQPGEEVEVKLNYAVPNPKKWTAETPNLYTTILELKKDGKITETISAKTGFCKIEIKGKLFLVNGVPIKLKGVNRHENGPEVGHAIDEAQMIQDLEVIKQGNCNHIRTSHYSNDPRWYELCDQYGIYLVAEANLECHGLRNRFNEEPTMKATIIDRNVANVESFKNHPSVIIWSLGNESGTGGSNFLAALTALKNIDSTRPTHYEGFGVGATNPADLDSKMYSPILPYNNPSPKQILLASVQLTATDTKLTKPFYLCEFAHAMFNSMGALKEYGEAIDKYPSLLGGAIWEFQDQGIWNRRNPQHPILAYGGGFGEFPNDHYFIHKGVVASDRSPKPHYPEMKHVFQWITVTADDVSKGIFTIRNKYQFINLDGLDGSYTITRNGTVFKEGKMDVSGIAARTEKQITVPVQLPVEAPEAIYFIRFSFALKVDELWAKKGFEIASDQILLQGNFMAVPPPKAVALPLGFKEADTSITVTGKGFYLVFSKNSGTLSAINYKGANLLQAGGGPKLHLWRAPHQQDDLYADTILEKKGIKQLRWKTSSIIAKQLSPSSISITAMLTGTGKNGFSIQHQVVYTILGDGSIQVKNDVQSTEPDVILARMGVRMFLNPEMQQFSYFGRGPMENYADRKSGSFVGLYSTTVAQQLTPYEKPMECGNHEEVRWATVSGKMGSLKIIADTSLLQVAALPYSDEEMAPVQYRIDLPKSTATVLNIGYKTLGVGSNSCGPTPTPECVVTAKPTHFTYTIQLLNK